MANTITILFDTEILETKTRQLKIQIEDGQNINEITDLVFNVLQSFTKTTLGKKVEEGAAQRNRIFRMGLELGRAIPSRNEHDGCADEKTVQGQLETQLTAKGYQCDVTSIMQDNAIPLVRGLAL